MRIMPLLVTLMLLSQAVLAGDTGALAPLSSIQMEEMTWQEIRDAIHSGKTTVIVPTGGTEQNGPHIVLGKHNFILRYTSLAIASQLGNALVAPIMAYVPEGDIHPPTGHMRFAGTLSLTPETFAAVLEDTAASLKQHGFTLICLVGEHGGSQSVQKAVAEKLSAAWKGDGVRVLHVSDYYDDANGQVSWLRQQGEKEPDPEAHGGLADTAEMLATYPQGVRISRMAPHTPADMDTLGAAGSATDASRAMGSELVALKVKAAVKQIRAAQNEMAKKTP